MLTIHESQPAEASNCHRVWQLPQRLVNRAIGQWCRSLGCVVQQQSRHIKHLMEKLRGDFLDNN